MATEIWVNIGSGKAITWTIVDLLSIRSSDIHLRQFSQEIPQLPMTAISFKITYLKFCSNLPGANELINNIWFKYAFANQYWWMCLLHYNQYITIWPMSALQSFRWRHICPCLTFEVTIREAQRQRGPSFHHSWSPRADGEPIINRNTSLLWNWTEISPIIWFKIQMPNRSPITLSGGSLWCVS